MMGVELCESILSLVWFVSEWVGVSVVKCRSEGIGPDKKKKS